MFSPVKEAASLVLAYTCLYSCSTSGFILLNPHNYSNILIEVVGRQPPPVKFHRLTYSSGKRQEEDLYMRELLGAAGV